MLRRTHVPPARCDLCLYRLLATSTPSESRRYLLAGAGSRLLTSFLYGLSPLDPACYVAVAVLLAASGLLATLLPVRKATHIDPAHALRAE